MVLNRASPLFLATHNINGIYMQKYSLPGNACFLPLIAFYQFYEENTHKNKKLTLF
jgi:hypothetical protein